MENVIDETSLSNESVGCEAEEMTVSNEIPASVPAQQANIANEKSVQAESCRMSHDTAKMMKEIEMLFAFPEEVVVHNFYKCTSDDCQHLTAQEQSRLKPSHDRFIHSWLFDKGLNVCRKTGLAWLVYQEGKGMFCFLCKKHNTENQQNKFKVFNATPIICFKKSAI